MKLFISNLPFTLSEAELRLVLENFGAVHSLMLAVNRLDGKSRGFAFAEMEEDIPGMLLDQLNSVDFSGKKLYAAIAVDKEAYRPPVLEKKKENGSKLNPLAPYDMKDFNNPQVAALPAHLRQYIAEQQYERYTAIDQAVWRYVMRQNYAYLKDVAYYPYIPGLKAAGLTIEKIPSLQEMNDALGTIGWGAVTVDGFIPPVAFMEFQAYRVLVIAADIRTLEHIDYTPAPDIIHESAGHAPIIADRAYHEYLSYFGSIGAKAVFSAQDFELYEAIRALSVIKEKPGASPQAIEIAEKRVLDCQNNMGEPSEMTLLSRLHWWTVEYGLIGTLEEPKIYGAGLLSSIGESASCMQPEVKKLPYTLDAINYPYDITKPQPQLFVTETFQNLIDVLEQFADTMAFRVGGLYGVRKAIASKNTCTAVFSSGLQVSGTFSGYKSYGDQLGYLQTTGPTQLAYQNKQLPGHSKSDHPAGFGCPVGNLIQNDTPLEYQLIAEGVYQVLHFECGILVMGTVTKVLKDGGRNLLISFKDCTVMERRGEIIFDPAMGTYELAVGEKIVSVYCGAADKAAFLDVVPKPQPSKKITHYDEKALALQHLYQMVRDVRHHRGSLAFLKDIAQELRASHPEDWLCALEILELSGEPEFRDYLEQKAGCEPVLSKLIRNGLNLIEN